MARRIENDLAQGDRFVVSRRNGALTAQARLHAGEKLVKGKRLGDVVVGAQLECQNLVDLLILRGQHNDRDGTKLANLLASFDPVEHGQHYIEHDQIRLLALRHRNCRATVAGGNDGVAAAFEIEAQRL